MTFNPYEVLDVLRTATAQEIKRDIHSYGFGMPMWSSTSTT